MYNRRKENRKKLMAFTPVYDAEKGTILGYLADLTMTGALIICDRPLETGSQLRLDIRFPDYLPAIHAEDATIAVRVMRCTQDESPRDYAIGFEFINIGPGQTKMVQAVLDRYHFRHQIHRE